MCRLSYFPRFILRPRAISALFRLYLCALSLRSGGGATLVSPGRKALVYRVECRDLRTFAPANRVAPPPETLPPPRRLPFVEVAGGTIHCETHTGLSPPTLPLVYLLARGVMRTPLWLLGTPCIYVRVALAPSGISLGEQSALPCSIHIVSKTLCTHLVSCP